VIIAAPLIITSKIAQNHFVEQFQTLNKYKGFYALLENKPYKNNRFLLIGFKCCTVLHYFTVLIVIIIDFHKRGYR